MKKFFLILSLVTIFISRATVAQEFVPEKISGIEVSGSYMAADDLGYIYLINESTLTKFDKDGLLLFTYTELSDGKISGVDVGDPLKTMIFNADFGKIKYLDNKLSLKKDFILLSDLGYPNANLISGSYDNGFWLFDPLTNQVVRFDKNLKATHNSGNISDIAGVETSPVFMTETDNILYLNDPANGILVFDRYATFMRLLPIKNLRSFQVFSNQIVFLEGNKLKMFDLKTFEESGITIPDDEEITEASWNNERIFVLTKKHLNIFKIK